MLLGEVENKLELVKLFLGEVENELDFVKLFLGEVENELDFVKFLEGEIFSFVLCGEVAEDDENELDLGSEEEDGFVCE
jgi:hypothetical protein